MTPGGNDRTTTVGIDFGGDGVRVASDSEGGPALVPVRPEFASLPRWVRFDDGKSGGAPGYHVLSLKRILAFDEATRSRMTDFDVLEYITRLFREIREDVAPRSMSGVLHVLGAVPPCFSQRQRSSLRTALTEAGFSRVKLLDDSLAALLGSWDRVHRKNTVLVYAWGASTFCASLYRPVDTGTFRPVIAPEGDLALGGDDLDSALLNGLAASRSLQEHADLRQPSPGVFAELERIKCALSRGEQASACLSKLGLSQGNLGGGGDPVGIPRALFEDAVAAMQEKTFALVDNVLGAGRCDKPDAVLLLGGTTAIPDVRRRLEARFPGRLVEAAEHAVTLGAVLHGRLLLPQEWEAADRRRESPAPSSPAVAFDPPPARPEDAEGEHMPAVGASGAGAWSKTLDVSPLLDKAESHHAKGQVDAALEALERAHSCLGEFASVVYDKAAADAFSSGHAEQAFCLLQRAHRLHPASRGVAWKYAKVCLRHSDHFLKKQKYREAWRCAFEAVTAVEGIPNAARDYPRELAACLHREACILYAIGRDDEAARLMERCVKLDPESARYADDLARIRGSRRGLASSRRKDVPANRVRVGRNAPCPCGSGAKYKNCCLS